MKRNRLDPARGSIVFILTLMMIIVCTTGCVSCHKGRVGLPSPPPPVEPMPVPVEAMPEPEMEMPPMAGQPQTEAPSAHLWEALYAAGEEPTGYAMYTYVLVGSNKDDEDAWNRYEVLVDVIQASTPKKSEYTPVFFDPAEYNLFLIPSVNSEDHDEENLNDQLAVSFLTEIATRTDNQKLQESANDPGPFLISLCRPLATLSSEDMVDILYVNLTTTNPSAIKEVVAPYKNRLTSSTFEEATRFTSLRLSLLDLILDADDYIQLVKVAYAEVIPG